MRHPVHDEELSMEEALAAIRRAITHEEAGETASPAEPRTSGEQAGAKRVPDAGLLSREATSAVGSAFNTLTEIVKKHEPSLEDVVRETLQSDTDGSAYPKESRRSRMRFTNPASLLISVQAASY